MTFLLCTSSTHFFLFPCSIPVYLLLSRPSLYIFALLVTPLPCRFRFSSFPPLLQLTFPFLGLLYLHSSFPLVLTSFLISLSPSAFSLSTIAYCSPLLRLLSTNSFSSLVFYVSIPLYLLLSRHSLSLFISLSPSGRSPSPAVPSTHMLSSHISLKLICIVMSQEPTYTGVGDAHEGGGREEGGM